MERIDKIAHELKAQIVIAIRRVQAGLRWKPGKARQHLHKRIALGHLKPEAQLTDYEAIILAIVSSPEAFIYVYRYGVTNYPTMVATYESRTWLVMFNLEGILETAFPPDEPDAYFCEDPRYIPVGIVKEILS